MTEILFDETGAGYRIIDLGSLHATWPFARLIMTSEGIQYRLLWKKIAFKYEDVLEISISRLGFLEFRVMQEPNRFAFGWLRLDKAVAILQSHNVQIAPEELRKLGFAVGFMKAQLIVVGVFLAVWLAAFLTGLSLIIFHLYET